MVKKRALHVLRFARHFTYIMRLSCFCRPEAQGVVCGAVFLITMFIFIPFPFHEHMARTDEFPFNEVIYKTEL